jgi:hypothetical protein
MAISSFGFDLFRVNGGRALAHSARGVRIAARPSIAEL